MTPARAAGALWRLLDDLCVPAGLYTGAATVLAALAIGARPHPMTLVAACMTGWSVYLFDRVKLRDAWLDPGDRAAAPARFGRLERWSAPLRALNAVLFLAATVCCALVEPALVTLPAGGHAAIALYAGAPAKRRGTRVKDRTSLKNTAVGLGVASFAIVIVRLGGQPAFETLDCVVLAALGLFVMADAALSDLDDRAADAAFGTMSPVVRFGAAPVVTACALTQVVAPVVAGVVTGAGVWWGLGALGVLTVPLLRWAPRGAVRALIDARLWIGATAIWIWLRMVG